MKTIPIFVAALLCVAGCSLAGGGEPPNFLVILCDDLGYGDLSSYGHPVIRTPNLDRLAGQGVRFTRFYSAAPVCSPSRVGLLTGRTPSRAGVYDWIPESHAMHMRRGEVTIAQLLKTAGYNTAVSGKWHCNGKFNSTEQPQPGDFGFDHWFATQNNAAPSHENPINFVRNGEPVGRIEGYASHIVADEAIRWLKGRGTDNPFFLYVAFHEPHEPVASPPDLVRAYLPHARNEDEAQYFANVANMDAAVGKLMAALDEMNLADDTLVVFTSDNGPETLSRYRGAHRSYGTPGPLRGMKLWLYEGGIRVPGIVRYPARLAPGQTLDQPVSSLDILPTFCELAGVEPPNDRALDGTSFTPILAGKEIRRETPLYWHYYRAWDTSPTAALMDGDWVVLGHPIEGKPKPGLPDPNKDHRIVQSGVKDFELYHLGRDLRQQANLATQHPDRLRKMADQLVRKHNEVTTEGPRWE